MILSIPFHNAIRAIALLTILLTSACGSRSTTVSIKGNIEGAQNQYIYIREVSHNKITTLDSTKIDDLGNFEFSIAIGSPSFILMFVNKSIEPAVLLLEPKENVIINGRKNNFASNYSVSGSRGSSLVRDLNFRLNDVVSAIDSLSRFFRSNQEHVKFDSIKLAVDKAYDRTIQEHKEFTINFIKENRYSLAAILALYQQYDKTRYVLDKREDFNLFRLVDSVLFPLYPENQLVYNLHSNVNMIGKQLTLYDKRQDMLDVGDMIPNVALPLLDGSTIGVHDIKAPYFLLDFWANWCNTCGDNNIILKGIYNQYARKGFEVVQFSLDLDKDELKLLVIKEGIPWVIASDFLQWDSPILYALSINSIPSNYLIDRNGLVLARNVSGAELHELLSKLLP